MMVDDESFMVFVGHNGRCVAGALVQDEDVGWVKGGHDVTF